MTPSPAATGAPHAQVIVICGGTSVRMGVADKTAMDLAGRQVLEWLLDGLPTGWPIICVGNPRATARSVSWTVEDPALGGPVAGIAAGLNASGPVSTGLPSLPVTALVAGDQPFAGEAVPALVDRLRAASAEVDVVAAAEPDGRPHLLLAAYRTSALRAALPVEPANRGVYASFGCLRVQELAVGTLAVLDLDTPQDLARARAHVRSVR